MAAPRIKKKQTTVKTSLLPRQGAIPCLILLALALVLIAVFFFASFHVMG
jgi:hypothetical protein